MRIDRNYTPKARSTVLSVEVDGEQVLYDERTGRLHALNDTAAIVWSCCDGTVTLGELVDELAEGFGATKRAVREGVYAVVRRLVDAGLLATDDLSAADPPPLPSPADLGSPCAPCLAKLDALEWVGSISVGLGELRTGVRVTSEGTLALLHQVLAYQVVDDPGAPVHYSLVVAEPSAARGARDLNRLYYGHGLVVRTRSQARAVRALIAHLDGHLDSTRADRVIVGGRALVRDDEVVLLSAEFLTDLDAAEPRLGRLGIAVCDAPSVELAGGGKVILTAPTLAVDDGAIGELERVDRTGRELAQPASGPRRLAGWVVPPQSRASAPLARPDALRAMMGTVRNLGRYGAGPALDVLTDQLSHVPIRSAPFGDPVHLVDEVVDLFGG